MRDTRAALPNPHQQILAPARTETLPGWDVTAEQAPRPGSFFIGTHVGMDAAISLQPEVVPVPQLPLVGLLQSAHQVRQVVLANEPAYAVNRKRPGRPLAYPDGRNPPLADPRGSVSKLFPSLRETTASPARTAAR